MSPLLVLLLLYPIVNVAVGALSKWSTREPTWRLRDDRGVFMFETRFRTDGSVNVDAREALPQPNPSVLAAACRAIDDWSDDVIVHPHLAIIDDPGLLRSAELLAGEFRTDRIARDVELAVVTGRLRDGDLRSALDGATEAELTRASAYLQARTAPPSAGAAERFVVYAASPTLYTTTIFRLEVDLDAEISPEPTFHGGGGDARVRLADGTTGVIPRGRCWD